MANSASMWEDLENWASISEDNFPTNDLYWKEDRIVYLEKELLRTQDKLNSLIGYLKFHNIDHDFMQKSKFNKL